MPHGKYRIQSISIEGFRGFTRPQTVAMDRRHAFIFGPNGCGKSSIIEAVRWCLFGSPPGKEIEVRNTFYSAGECNVSMVLVGENSELHLRRELRPGATRSRQTIRDGTGATRAEHEVLPQLARIGHQQGTQVIFSAQHSVSRQAQVDISDFTRVLCFYLNMESIPDLVADLAKRAEALTTTSEQMGSRLEKLEGQIREKIKRAEEWLAGLTANAPWGTSAPPTEADTSASIMAFVDALARLLGKSRPGGTDRAALSDAKQWIDESRSLLDAQLMARATSLRSSVAKAKQLIESAKVAESGLSAAISEQQAATVRLAAVIGGSSAEVLEQELAEKQNRYADASACLSLLEGAAVLLAGSDRTVCPICLSNQEPAELIGRITAERHRVASECPDAPSVAHLKEVVSEVRALRDAQIGRQAAIDECRKELETARDGLGQLFGQSSLPDGDVAAAVGALESDLASIERQISDASAEHASRLKRMSELDVELDFHQKRRSLERLRGQLDQGLSDSRERLKDFLDRLASVRRIAEVLEECFNDVLDRATPALDEMMTDVYRRLTGQVSYDLVRVVSDPSSRSRRELRVASSRREGATFAVNVLNGQAAKSIQLVPYFVFSRFHAHVLELDLLLIDDPSESFDTSHVGRLVEVLAEAAGHAQLIVATHEEDKFRPHLRTTFASIPFVGLNVASFGPDDGPQIAT